MEHVEDMIKDQQVSVDLCNDKGESALGTALKHNKLRIAKFLIENGAHKKFNFFEWDTSHFITYLKATKLKNLMPQEEL